MKVASETGQSIRRVADCGRVATRGARRGARRSKAHRPCQSPEAACPRHKDREVVRTNCTKSHTSSHPLPQPTKQVDAEILGEAKPLLEESTGLLQVMQILSFYSNWCNDLWCCYDTSTALVSAPLSTRLYTEWMIPPKCILEFCTNTFSVLSKQCSPLSRYIGYAFLCLVAWMCKRVKERWKDKEAERERSTPSPKDISSVNSVGTFSIPSAFFFTCRTDS